MHSTSKLVHLSAILTTHYRINTKKAKWQTTKHRTVVCREVWFRYFNSDFKEFEGRQAYCARAITAARAHPKAIMSRETDKIHQN